MKIPKEIVEKMEQVNSLMEEIDKWLCENANVEGSIHDYEHGEEYEHEDWYTFRDKPTGDEQRVASIATNANVRMIVGMVLTITLLKRANTLCLSFGYKQKMR